MCCSIFKDLNLAWCLLLVFWAHPEFETRYLLIKACYKVQSMGYMCEITAMRVNVG